MTKEKKKVQELLTILPDMAVSLPSCSAPLVSSLSFEGKMALATFFGLFLSCEPLLLTLLLDTASYRNDMSLKMIITIIVISKYFNRITYKNTIAATIIDAFNFSNICHLNYASVMFYRHKIVVTSPSAISQV